ncbi:DUF1801 domain-containing protein [Jannaschia sp. S6380]|uniref:DUF1801 domain-containing protein n=1 Tax=Jannaschia sp. S6380 TaxID=2926408 RepID=UPI001FF42114|nr:DUF1801 domain-containing protein [Jannaschia sp. S6380]MCK0168814.1 DUF1801 domain-containing protein [Jannaschia sp. S6380]
MNNLRPDDPAAVAAVFDTFPDQARPTLLDLRALILTAAADMPAIGPLTETLKWGQPAYLPARPRIGTTVGLGQSKGDEPALFVHCRTTLVANFRLTHPDTFRFEGNRAVLLDADRPLPEAPLRHFVQAALSYHLKRG